MCINTHTGWTISLWHRRKKKWNQAAEKRNIQKGARRERQTIVSAWKTMDACISVKYLYCPLKCGNNPIRPSGYQCIGYQTHCRIAINANHRAINFNVPSMCCISIYESNRNDGIKWIIAMKLFRLKLNQTKVITFQRISHWHIDKS